MRFVCHTISVIDRRRWCALAGVLRWTSAVALAIGVLGVRAFAEEAAKPAESTPSGKVAAKATAPKAAKPAGGATQAVPGTKPSAATKTSATTPKTSVVVPKAGAASSPAAPAAKPAAAAKSAPAPTAPAAKPAPAPPAAANPAAPSKPAPTVGAEAKAEAAPAPPEAPILDDKPKLTAKWKDGLRLKSEDDAFEVKIGGRIHIDWAFLSGDEAIENEFGPLEDGTEVRRLQLESSGLFRGHYEYEASVDVSGGEVEIKDVYLGILGIPMLGGVRIGHQKEPFGLEELTSDKYVSFAERSLTDAFVPSRNTGILFHNEIGEHFTWAVGAFRNTEDAGGTDTGDGEWAATARLTAVPIRIADGRYLVHFGVAYSHRVPGADAIGFEARPEVHLAPKFVRTPDFLAENVDLFGAEMALVMGPISLQGEHMLAKVERENEPELEFRATYGMVSIFLTGEHRPYDTEEAAFGRLRPRHNLFAGGAGAFELVGRWSRIELDDEEVHGGQMEDLTVGLNWYFNPNLRWTINWVRPELEGVGEADLLTTRFAVDF